MSFRLIRQRTDLGPTAVGAFLFGVGIASAVSAQDRHWRQMGDSGPSPRTGHVMAFDSWRGVTVLFGGETAGGFSNETWEWDGRDWRLASTEGPQPRALSAAGFDSHRGVTVLFGGQRPEGGSFRETWEWDGSMWTLVSDGGPVFMYNGAMSFDTRRRVIVYYCSVGSIDLNTWVWDGSRWDRVAFRGPANVYRHAMVYDEKRDRTVLVHRRYVWEWNGEYWDQAAYGLPEASTSFAMGYDPSCGITVLFGGTGASNWYDQTWEWNGVIWSQIDVIGPSERATTGAFDHLRGRLVVFGGADGSSFLGDTWEYGSFHVRLDVDATCPEGGPITIECHDATPLERVALLIGRREREIQVPPTYPCSGTMLGIVGGLRVVAVESTDARGHLIMQAHAGEHACDRFLQLIDLATCSTSNVARIE